MILAADFLSARLGAECEYARRRRDAAVPATRDAVDAQYRHAAIMLQRWLGGSAPDLCESECVRLFQEVGATS